MAASEPNPRLNSVSASRRRSTWNTTRSRTASGMSPPHWRPPARAERYRMAARRVALTGAGIISPLGNTLEDFYRSLAGAKSGIARLPEAIALGSGVQVGAMVDWKPAALF